MFNPITATLEANQIAQTDTHNAPEYRTAFYKSLMGKELTDAENRAFAAAQAEKRADAFNTLSSSAAVVPTTTLNEIVKQARGVNGLFNEVRCADVKGKGHFGQIAAPDGFIYRPCLLCVRQACPHFKPLFSDGQGKGFRASRKRNAAAVMIGYQHNAVKINTPQCVRVYDLSHSADLGGRIEYYRDTL